MKTETDALAAALAKGHGAPPALLTPAMVPADYAQSAEVQALVAQRLGATVAGWKVAIRPEGVAVAAPLFASLTTDKPALSAPAQGLMGIEVEIGLRLNSDLPPRPGKPYTRDDVLAATGSLFTGIELVSTRLPDHPNAPFSLVLADNMANGGYVIGKAITEWRGLDLSALVTSVVIDGKPVYEKRGGHGNVDPLAPVVAYVNAPFDRLGGFKAGQIVTTGTLCGLIPVAPTAKVEAHVERIGGASLHLSPRG